MCRKYVVSHWQRALILSWIIIEQRSESSCCDLSFFAFQKTPFQSFVCPSGKTELFPPADDARFYILAWYFLQRSFVFFVCVALESWLKLLAATTHLAQVSRSKQLNTPNLNIIGDNYAGYNHNIVKKKCLISELIYLQCLFFVQPTTFFLKKSKPANIYL